MSSWRNILKTGAASVLSKFVRGGEQLILVPFFLKSWGAAYYGDWITLAAIPAALALSDLGIGTAFASEFVLRHSAGSPGQAAAVMKMANKMLSMISLIAMGIVLTMLQIAWNREWLGALNIPVKDAIIAVGLMSASRLVYFFTGLTEAYFRAARKTYVALNIFTAAAAMRVAAAVLVLTASGHIVLLAATDLLVSIVTVVVAQCWGRIMIGHLPNNYKLSFKNETLPLLRKSFSYLLDPVRQALSLQGTIVIIRTFIGGEAVVLFSTMRTITNTAHQLVSLIDTSLFPEFQHAIATRRFTIVKKLYLLGFLGGTTISMIACLALAIFGPWLYSTWTSGSLTPAPSLWAIFLLMLLVRGIWWTPAMAFRGSNSPEQFTIVAVLSACLGMVISTVLTPVYGLMGTAVGLLCMEISLLLYVLPASSKLIGLKMSEIVPLLYENCHYILQKLQKK